MEKIYVDIDSLDSITTALNILRDIFLSRKTDGTYEIVLNKKIPCSDEIYSVGKFLQECECPVDDETFLFLTAAQYPSSRDQMIELIKQVSDYNQKETTHGLMRNCEMPFGFFMALALALHNDEQVFFWTEFIKGLDLNHEVYEMPAMEALFRIHGLTSNMLDLAVKRVLLPGQFGWDQVRAWLMPVKDQPVFADFIKRLADATYRSFIEDTSTYKSLARNNFSSMNCFLDDWYRTHELFNDA